MPKRKVQEIDPENEDDNITPPTKRTRMVIEQNTPSKRTPKKTPNKMIVRQDDELELKDGQKSRNQRSVGNGTYRTPQKSAIPNGRDVYIVKTADRSARRRSARNLIEQTITGELSDQEDATGQSLAQEIFQEDINGVESEEDEEADNLALDTPSKSNKDKRKSRRKKSPTPPTDLAPHERYFYDNRPTAAKTSMNTLSAEDLISHSAYHEAITQTEDPHTSNIEDLHVHHEGSFPLWSFELFQQYSLCLYGYGSKLRILKSFASYVYKQDLEKPPTIIMINGTHPEISLKSVLGTLAAAILPTQHTKLPTQPQQLTAIILDYLSSRAEGAPIYLLISAFHTKTLSAAQSLSILSQLASHRSIHLVLTADNASFPLLFPAQLRANFNFLFHDTTTFVPYDVGTTESELSTVVDTVLELIGRRTSAATGREGVRWVLKSLPENARGLYRILVSEILAAAAEGSGPAFHTQSERLDESMNLDGILGPKRGRKEQQSLRALPGIDAKILYQKSVEEFLCSSEMMFWSLLKEFVDHRMVIVRKERGVAGGGEMLGVEIGKDELEGILEDLLE